MEKADPKPGSRKSREFQLTLEPASRPMASKSERPDNRYQKAVEVLQKGREVLLRDLAEDIIDRAEDFEEGGFLFQEFLENQGTKLHFLYLMVSQLEQSSEAFEEARRKSEPTPSKRGRKSSSSASPPPVEEEAMLFPDVELDDYANYDDFADEHEIEHKPKKKKTRRRGRKVRTESSMPSPMDEE